MKVVCVMAVAGLLLLSYVVVDYYMLQKTVLYSHDSSTAMNTFAQSSEWLSKMLKPNEKAIVPTAFIFEVLNPELSGRLIDCQFIWDAAGVKLHERSSKERLGFLQNWFNQFLRNNSQIKYVVKDWVDLYDKYLFEGNLELSSILEEVKVIPFTLHSGWSNRIVIFEQVHYGIALNENFSREPTHHLHPSNASVTFGSNGLELTKNEQQTGFYLELSRGLNCSLQSYVLLNATFNVENSTLTIVFYYDNNKDGVFSGYDSSDYVKSGLFSQTLQGYAKGQQYTLYQTIPSETDLVVQIGIIVNGAEKGSFGLHNLAVFTELT